MFNVEFSQALHESVLIGLESALGQSGAKAVLISIDLDRCSDKPEALHTSLCDLFKDGAFVLEKFIVKELCQRLGFACEERIDLDFVGCVNHAKELFLRKREEAATHHTANKEPVKNHSIQPRLKVIKSRHNSPAQISFVVIDTSKGSEYPQNFVCVFPMNLFRKNQKGNLKRSRFFRVFGEKSNEMAKRLLGEALKTEIGLEVRRQIEAVLRDADETYRPQGQEVSFPH